MSSQWKWIIAASVFVTVAALAWGELVLDIEAPRLSLPEFHSIATTVAIPIGDYEQAMRRKYGSDAVIILTGVPPKVIIKVEGKVVEEGDPPISFGDARGIFVMGAPGHIENIFPFQINPRSPWATSMKAPALGQYLRNRFGNRIPARYLQFDDQDVSTEICTKLSVSDLGWLGALLRFRGNAFCVVSSKGTPASSMLISVALADGAPWMQPFTRRICRWLTTTALGHLTSIDDRPLPDYAACVLADRPDRSGAVETLQAHVYAVGRDATLAYVN